MLIHIRRLVVVALLLANAFPIRADGPKDNLPDQVRPVPPIGIELEPDDRAELERGLARLEDTLSRLRLKSDERTQSLLPDVEIFSRAIRQGLEYRELFSKRDVDNAKQVLEEGQRRADQLMQGNAYWTRQKGLVVRGYRSRIDKTVQPYGLVVPETYEGEGLAKYRLDLWFHGRGERSSESVFIAERMNRVGRFAPRDTLVLHPYGRYSNAFKFAGEVDVLEAMQHAKQHYRVDANRIAVRGFSMGGAGCWQMAVHYPDLFFAANPGAGFSETPEFLKFFQQETLQPTWYEEKLWRMYDCPGYAINLMHLPTVAYSGELDIQKQAADIMEQTLAEMGVRLTHIIGSQTKHTIDPASIEIIEAKLDRLAEVGRDQLPLEVRFATFTLKYNRMHWMTVTGMGAHWEQASVHGTIRPEQNLIELDVANVTGMRLSIPAGRSPFALDRPVRIKVRGAENELLALRTATDRSWECALHHDGKSWKLGAVDPSTLRKRHNLQGPIDDAFMDSFIVVRPTGAPSHAAIGEWADAELDRLIREWRRQFRGDAVVKLDSEITKADIDSSHLILFGDPSSNSITASVMDQLPVLWDAEHLQIGNAKFDSTHHAPVMIYPNPLNPKRYVVLNSGFTYREYAYLNNARQVPKLPDWSVVDIRVPPDSLWPGRIAAADFFDETWGVK